MVGWTTHSHGGEKIYTFWVNLEDKRARLTFAGGGGRGWRGKQSGVSFRHRQFEMSARYLSGNNKEI